MCLRQPSRSARGPDGAEVVGEREEENVEARIGGVAEEAVDGAFGGRALLGEQQRAQVGVDHPRDEAGLPRGEAQAAQDAAGDLGARVGVPEEADAAGLFDGLRLGLADVVQEGGQLEDGEPGSAEDDVLAKVVEGDPPVEIRPELAPQVTASAA